MSSTGDHTGSSPVKKLDTRLMLLAAAVDELKAHGESGLRIESILQAANASFSSLYHHFGNREGLVLAAQIEMLQAPISRDGAIFAELVRDVHSKDDLIAWLKKGVAMTHGQANAIERAQQLAIYSAAEKKPELAAAISAANQQLTYQVAGLFSDLRSRGIFESKFSDELMAQFVQTLVLGQVVVERDSTPTDKAVWHEAVLVALLSLLGIRI
jgi:AcrR family transcriptional regulator